jgi:hypothetical protein
MTKLALIDCDGLFYQSATDTMENSMQKFRDKFNNIIEKTEATHYLGFYSRGKYFRHDIDKNYKGNRKYDPPKFMKSLKEWSIAEYGFATMNLVEADDLIAYWANQDICIDNNLGMFETRSNFESALSQLKKDEKFSFESVQKIVASPDKDIILNIPGQHFNYTYKIKEESKLKSKEELTDDDISKGWWVVTDHESANYNKMKQILVGDQADNVKTLFPESAGDWFVKNKMNFNNLLEAYILGFYYETPTGMKKFIKGLGTSQGLYEFQKNYRLLHLLNCDEDFIREIGEVPSLPEVRRIEVNIPEENVIEF